MFNCPQCNQVLTENVGTQIHPNNPEYGITLFCSYRKCPVQEVMGHGDNAKKAFEVIQLRFAPRTEKN